MKNKYTRLKWLAVIIIAILLSLLALPAQAASANYDPPLIIQQEVRGVVSDQEGMPLPGVTVIVKGENRGTVTDIDGQYSIAIAPEDHLVFSFIGYKTHQEAVLGRREINIKLEEDVSQLGEVQINAGYYNTTRRESTGNISRVTAEEIEMQPVISPLQALQGRMAGVEILPGGNQPGMASTIRIRGRNSLREEGNFPLYIIDGVPYNSAPIESNTDLGGTGIDPLNMINLSSIESIEVLKDADATAIYGSRGANGVVLITTKKGQYKKSSLETRFFTGVASVPNRVDLLNTDQYIRIRQQAFINDEVQPDQYNAYDLLLWDQDRYTDWQDFFFGNTSTINNVSIATNGGNENTSYRINGSYHNQGTVYRGDFIYNKITAGLSLQHTSVNRKLNIDLKVNYGVDNNNLVGNVNLTFDAFRLPPNAPDIFNEDGSLNWVDWTEAGRGNPLEGFFNTSKTNSNNLLSSFGISYEIIQGLHFKSNLGYTFFNSREILKRPKRSYNPSIWENINHQSNHLEIDRKSWIVEPQLNYQSSLGKSGLDVLVGATFQKSEYARSSLIGQGYVSESLIGNLSSAETVLSDAKDHTTYRYAALFGRLGFNWDKRYFLNFTGRRDGSSRFGPGKQIANFGAIGAAWIFSEEPFVNNANSFWSYGKLRGSYGTTGNDQIGDYGYLDAYEATKGPGGLYPTQLSNPDYSWEINKKLEVAVELGFLKDRINIGLSWYGNRSSNQLVGYALPTITGFTTIQANLPATVENTGWEGELSFNVFSSKNLKWHTFFNLTVPKNQLVSYPGLDQSSYANTYKVGHPLNIQLLYQYKGLDPETGYYTIADVNEDGRFDYEDDVVIQDLGRKLFGGLSNTLSYKNFSLQFLLDFVKQNGTLHLFNAGELSNQRAVVLRGLEEGATFQRISASPQSSNAYYQILLSDLPVVDASFLRLKNISLSYFLPSSVIKRTGLSDAKLFLNGHNLYTLTNYEGMDPEMPLVGNSFAGLRTITGGIEINF